MKDLAPEVQASLIRWAGQAALVSADRGMGKKGKGKKKFNDLFANDFETNYKQMREIIERVDNEPEAQ